MMLTTDKQHWPSPLKVLGVTTTRIPQDVVVADMCKKYSVEFPKDLC